MYFEIEPQYAFWIQINIRPSLLFGDTRYVHRKVSIHLLNINNIPLGLDAHLRIQMTEGSWNFRISSFSTCMAQHILKIFVQFSLEYIFMALFHYVGRQ